ncbi:UDP-N-acetylmuramoyl-L-alanine--D-glutamate ligase [Parasporobacterium paucivorans]|uniref:UDP-N-acetylmuramoylalanine--D-glutamate ligase n=1 Tax=Parasporobacterium paucivorans DSM 15970 TaxID=1122934 RepID=A0A1M6G2U8_9FIRM|nr:UDP-N-acetylmuramoyl-L-alanine--D-glutamate ligase [Parasporobacterium paucivorans]SHJ04230.1 UDP-N-acetylmuramoylalanine--D-glutamate ligase [Parasporobacterium paucivorans DSM 15970]
MDFIGKTFIIAGMGVSGQGAVSLLKREDVNLVLFDANERLDKEEFRKRMGLDDGTPIYLGEFPRHELDLADYLVLSPGISVETEFVREAEKAGVLITGEIELAFQFNKGRLIAITGTNGKTTTTALTGAIMKEQQEQVFVVGNIGTSFAGAVLNTTRDSVTVAEISSFQLETADTFRPDVSGVLNVTPDHLDRHHTMEKYLETKMKIAANQGKEDVCVLNYEDERLRNYAPRLDCQIIFFSSGHELQDGIYLDEDKIIIRRGGEKVVFCRTGELNLLGKHNYENVMAAIALTMATGVPLDVIRSAVLRFKSVEHRIEYVATKGGVAYYNDSKGTNTDAAIKAIHAMPGRTVLIAGGYDKGAVYDEWVEAFGDKVTCLILMGATRDKIARTAKEFGHTNILFVESMEEAVKAASKEAVSGEFVLLSPACASWGMFKNYEERGRIFKDCVNRI